ncbi:ATP-binding cassette domain-containing protein [Nocardia sp. NBC_00508]|uniref:ATP-binding cassette domain-containing protein n=1 Tax=Nocardia sp. NBC_00508 TaxID=2975992 RepID=UPI002E8245BC|nr:ATP-binding cassette domain-containing protein [Nocardia sp. NBC_00508]WUD69025.1 ATP-binding cassette domain-containing protein [Nocardia sp. NBC_00508]
MRDRAHTSLPTTIPAVAQLSVKSVTKSYGTRTILDQVSFTVRPGEKAAVIGENGSGKSTLLRLLATAETPDAGEVTVRFPGGTGYLAQTLDLDADCTVQDAVDLALTELRDIERRLRAAEESLADRRAAGTAPRPQALTPVRPALNRLASTNPLKQGIHDHLPDTTTTARRPHLRRRRGSRRGRA